MHSTFQKTKILTEVMFSKNKTSMINLLHQDALTQLQVRTVSLFCTKTNKLTRLSSTYIHHDFKSQ